jgi:hypothetical protein
MSDLKLKLETQIAKWRSYAENYENLGAYSVTFEQCATDLENLIYLEFMNDDGEVLDHQPTQSFTKGGSDGQSAKINR